MDTLKKAMPTGRQGKILFIVHDVYQDDNRFPFGPAYLAAVLRDNGHEVQIYSQDVFHYSNEELAEFLDNNDFDMIGLGFLAARYAETVRPLAKVINEHKKGAKFVLGGHGVTPIPEYILNDTKADIAVLGEGEKTIIPLIDAILGGEPLNSTKGIAYRAGNQIKVNQRTEPVMDLDSLPFPAWDLFPMEKYVTCYSFPGSKPQERHLPVLSSRGCINNCSFCYRMEKGIRTRSIENLFKELKFINSEYGVTYFIFDDEMFVPSKTRIKEFSSIPEKLGTKIKYSCNARVELAKDKSILKMLKESGCQLLNFGLESLDQNVLNLMGKNTKVEENHEAVINTIEAGMHPGLNFIWGNPGDTLESLDKIVNFLIQYDTLGQLRTVRPPTPYPSSPLYYKAIEDGKLSGPGDFFEKFVNSDRMTVNFTALSDDEVYSAFFKANSILVKNHFEKRAKLFNEGKEECDLKAQQLIDSFKRVYFPQTPEDFKFRGARHYNKK